MKQSLFLLLDHDPQYSESLGERFEFVLDHARLAEDLGFDALWLAEHHFQRVGSVPNPAVMRAAVAARTRRLRVGPAVGVLPYRDPVFVAEDYALVDLISGGRLNRGVRCGSQTAEFAELGADFENRRRSFQENLEKLRDLWSSDRLNVAPEQSPPPIFVATTSVENAFAMEQKGDSIITLLAPGRAVSTTCAHF